MAHDVDLERALEALEKWHATREQYRTSDPADYGPGPYELRKATQAAAQTAVEACLAVVGRGSDDNRIDPWKCPDCGRQNGDLADHDAGIRSADICPPCGTPRPEPEEEDDWKELEEEARKQYDGPIIPGRTRPQIWKDNDG